MVIRRGGAKVYADHWQYLWPYWLLDLKYGVVWRLQLELLQVVRTSADPVLLVPFLQRRIAGPAMRRAPKEMLLYVIRTLIEELTTLPTLCCTLQRRNLTAHICGILILYKISERCRRKES